MRYIFQFLTAKGKNFKIENTREISKFKYLNNSHLNILFKIKILNYVINSYKCKREINNPQINKKKLIDFFLKEKLFQFALLEKLVLSNNTTKIFLDYGYIANKIPFLINDRNHECVKIVSQVKHSLKQRLKNYRNSKLSRASNVSNDYLMAVNLLLGIADKQDKSLNCKFYEYNDNKKKDFTMYEINQFKRFLNESLTNQKISEEFKKEIFFHIKKIIHL